MVVLLSYDAIQKKDPRTANFLLDLFLELYALFFEFLVLCNTLRLLLALAQDLLPYILFRYTGCLYLKGGRLNFFIVYDTFL